jgi:hypothetical protein
MHDDNGICGLACGLRPDAGKRCCSTVYSAQGCKRCIGRGGCVDAPRYAHFRPLETLEESGKGRGAAMTGGNATGAQVK